MIRKTIGLLFLVMTLALPQFYGTVTATVPAQHNNDSWNANWITHPSIGPAEENSVYFRKNFTLESVPNSFPIAITADNHFRLYVNGKWVAWGPQLGMIDHWKYDELDLADHLRAGENTLAVQVINWGHRRFFGMQSVHTGLLIQGYGPAAVLTTNYDQDYVCLRDEGWSTHEVRWRTGNNDIIGGLYANNPTDSLDAARHPFGWADPKTVTTDWTPAQFLDPGHRNDQGSGFLWLVEPRTTPPQQRRAQTFARTRMAKAPAGPKGWHLGRRPRTLPANGSYRFLLDMNEVTLGFFTLRWSGGRGSQMKYTWAENVFRPDGSKTHRDSVNGMMVKGYFDVITADGGADRSYTPSWYRTCRYLEILVETGDEPLQLFAPTFERVTSTVPISATWSSDDPKLDEVWEIGKRTVELCTQDYFLSDAYYETMQYIGDTKVHALVWQALTGDFAHSRNALTDFHRSRNEDGMLKSCSPLRYNFYHSSYSLIFIDMLWDYVERTGDTAFVEPFLPGVRQTIAYFDAHVDPDTKFLTDIKYKPFVDWYIDGRRGLGPDADLDASLPHTLQYVHALESARKLLGEEPDLTYSAAEIRGAVAGATVTAGALLSDTPGRDDRSQQGNILAELTAGAPNDERLMALLETDGIAQATYYFRYYLFELLRRRGRADLVTEALEPYYQLVDLGATTTVERFESPQKGTRSEAHPWGASPTLFVYSLLAGIDFAYPEDGVIRMAPAFGHLTEMRGFCPVFGPTRGVRFDLKREGERLTGSVTASEWPVEIRWGERQIYVGAGMTFSLE